MWGWLVGWLNWFNVELSPKRYWRGPKSQEVGGTERLYPTLYCHHQNGSCINVGSDESYFNVSLIVRDKITNTLLKRKCEGQNQHTRELISARMTSQHNDRLESLPVTLTWHASKYKVHKLHQRYIEDVLAKGTEVGD